MRASSRAFLPVGAEVERLQALQVAWSGTEPEPVEMRPRVAVVVVVVEVGRRGDQEVHARLVQGGAAVEERFFAHAPVVPLRVRASVSIPGDILRHLPELRRDGAGHVVVLHLGPPGRGLAPQAGLVGVVGVAHHGRGEGEAEESGDRRLQRLHEIERQQYLALDRRAVEGRAGAEGGGRGRLGRTARAPAFRHERLEGRSGGAEPRGLQPMGPELRARGEGGEGVDLEADGSVAGEVGLDQCRADAGEGVQHHPRPGQVARQRVLDELPREAGNPGHPAVHRRLPVGREGGVAEGAALGRPCARRRHRPGSRPDGAQGTRIVDPVVLRPSRSRWAWAASASG